MDFDNLRNKELPEAFSVLVSTYDFSGGFDKRRFLSLVGDLAPHLKKENQRIRIINQTDAFCEIYEASSAEEAEKNRVLEKTRSATGMVDNWADYILLSFAWAFGWKVTPIKPDEEAITQEIFLEDKIFTVNDAYEHLFDGILNIPSGFTEIEKNALQGNKSILSLTLPVGMRKIDKYAFDGCENLRSVTMSDTVTEIGESAFCMCTSLENIVFSKCLKTIGDTAFWKCTSLKNITMPASIKKIGHATFMECSSLISVSLAGELSVVSDSLFRNCVNLKEVSLPENVNAIERMAFGGCKSLFNIYVSGKVSRVDRLAFGTSAPNLTITCPPGSVAWKFCEERGIKYTRN